MIDYREELDFKISLMVFLIDNFSVNKNGKKQITIEKLRLLSLICLTPKTLDKVSKKLNKTPIFCYQKIFYEGPSKSLSATEFKDISLLIAFLCKKNYLKLVKDDLNYIIIGEKVSSYAGEISSSVPQYLFKNQKLIKLISTKSEAQIAKALMDA